ncbi:MAG: peptide chain release factor N(5)-glutamine methyltransferase [Actinomycetota bacterium]
MVELGAPTVRSLLADAVRSLADAGVGSPAVDAELLLAHSVGVERARLVTVDRVTPGVARRFSALVARRVAREPLQHLLGTAPFRYLELAVGPGVFVPRPETELLLDGVLPMLRQTAAPVVVDLCAGSGVLALAALHEAPHATVYAVERSPGALSWLRRNAAGTGVHIVQGDVANPSVLGALDGQVNVVLSNPPYVPIATPVAPEVAHDPAEAVFAGTDGLSVIPAVIAAAGRLLRRDGLLALEHDDSHASAVIELLESDARWRDVQDHRDLAGRPRYATATRKAA